MEYSADSKTLTLYERLEKQIETQILGQNLLPGGRVPSVRAMRTRTGASISTILHAYHNLEDRGIIEARPQSGYFVRLNPQQPLTFYPIAIFSIRKLRPSEVGKFLCTRDTQLPQGKLPA